MSYAAVVNRNSGYVMTHSPALVRAMLDNATGEKLSSVHMVEGAEIESALAEAFDSGPDAVIVLGGDGTARTAAEHARRSGVPVIPLPGGTMNLLPRRLYGEGDPADCLRKALSGSARFLDAGEAGGHLFFLQGLFGVAPNIARAREAVRDLTSLSDLPHVFDNAGKAIKNLFSHERVSWRLSGRNESHEAETLVVSVGSLERVMNPCLHVSERDFELIGMQVHDAGEALRLGFHALTSHLRDDPGVEVQRSDCIEVTLCDDDHSAVLDGEPVELPVNVTVRYLRDVVPVVAPETAEP